MQKIISKYGLAAHLALMTVAPLVLLPFLGSDTTATMLLWLSLFGFVWVLMEPSRRHGEMSNDAKRRVTVSMLGDPLFWLSLVVVVYSGISALNSGIAVVYDAEQMTWFVCSPAVTFLPGCVEHGGYFQFASVVALAVVFQGLRHALGRSARISYVFVSSLTSGLAAMVMAVSCTYGHSGIGILMNCSTLFASYYGTAFGLQLLCSVAALGVVMEKEWVRSELFVAVGFIGNAIGLVMFSPVHTIAAFAGAYIVLVLVSFVIVRKRCSASASLRFFLAVLLSMAAPVLFMMSMTSSSVLADKIVAIKTYLVFPEGYFTARETISAIALKTWKASPWLGTGLDSFPYDIRFMATAIDWETISSLQKTALSGWWQLLAERGVIGCALIALVVGMLAWTYVVRLIRSWAAVQVSAAHVLGPIALLVLIAVSFVDCSFLRPEVLLVSGAVLAFSGSAFPARSATQREEKEV